MTEEVQRNYLEINSIQDLNKVIEPEGDYSLDLLEPLLEGGSASLTPTICVNKYTNV